MGCCRYGLEQLHGDDTCFTVIADLQDGCWLLFAASVLSLLGSRFVLRTCHAALATREEQSRHPSLRSINSTSSARNELRSFSAGGAGVDRTLSSTE